MKRSARVVAAVLAAAFLLGTGAAARAQKPIRIGASAPRRGRTRSSARTSCAATSSASSTRMNRAACLDGRSSFVVEDDRSEPAAAVRIYERLITQDKGDLVLGPYGSPMTEPVTVLTEEYRMPMVAPTVGTTSIFRQGRRFISQIYTPAEMYLEGFVELAARHGLKTIALIGEDSLFPQAAVKGAAELAGKRGCTSSSPRPTPGGRRLSCRC